MPEIEINSTIRAPIDSVWSSILDIESYPRTMSHVREVKIVEQLDAHRRKAAWSVLLKGSILEWVEEERVDEEVHRIDFRQLTGDLAHFDGHWAVESSPQTGLTNVEFVVEFEIGIPSLAEMLNPVATRALRESCDKMLAGIERQSVD